MSDYTSGMDALKILHSKLKDKSLSFDQFIEALKLNSWGDAKIPEADFKQFVETVGYAYNGISKISWFGKSDFEELLEKVANATPMGKLPDRRSIISAFLQEDVFKPSFLDIASITAKSTAQAVQTVSERALGVIDFVEKAKPLILIGALGFIAYKLLGQSDKIKAAYNTVKKDTTDAYKHFKKK